MSEPKTDSLLTCPACGSAKRLEMPTDACLVRYHCAECGAELRPLARDCCVFCSYGDTPCPPIQLERRQ